MSRRTEAVIALGLIFLTTWLLWSNSDMLPRLVQSPGKVVLLLGAVALPEAVMAWIHYVVKIGRE